MHHFCFIHLPYTLHNTPYTIHHIPYTIYHIPYTIHNTPYTIHHIPYTIHYIPRTMQHADDQDLDRLLSLLPSILSEDTYTSLKTYADQVNLAAALRLASPNQLRFLLLRATYEADKTPQCVFGNGHGGDGQGRVYGDGDGYGEDGDVSIAYLKGLRVYTTWREGCPVTREGAKAVEMAFKKVLEDQDEH
ncbi:hypothetical protein EON63_12575 [archaeon]|nr:MAG: hypothetical protein EON63_12575 [archaeon]